MPTPSFILDVSYSQIAVFDGSLKQPFSFWTEKHVNQGFAWESGERLVWNYCFGWASRCGGGGEEGRRKAAGR